ncbi:MAG: hypothetical protein GOMPHAMPRED_007188 [Gomphillus americanus]|uniref:FCP1 homology domain-containing protein n=1 Tax=Gomphillus americanus TaxID=1940652 RepID=A0A8H3ESY5_9LECA|nr:MAG: hypothetical protein GOMPHAMPRED_007188 [Gomphillus americanus]
MNSLNLISAKVIGTIPKPIRSRSLSTESRASNSVSTQPRRSFSQHSLAHNTNLIDLRAQLKHEDKGKESFEVGNGDGIDEKTPLLEEPASNLTETKEIGRSGHLSIKRIFDAITEGIKWVLIKIASPAIYVVSCFCDSEGRFSLSAPFKRTRRRPSRTNTSSVGQTAGMLADGSDSDRTFTEKTVSRTSSRRSSASTNATSDSDQDTRPKRPSLIADELPSRRSIRIKLNNEENARRKKARRLQSASDLAQSSKITKEEAAAAKLKSPTSPASSLGITKYPQAPVPPRPLIPRRQPSYTHISKNSLAQKTLVLDLDETLIHSLAKGGRMSTGHMVEVKLASPAAYNGLSLGPQHPILYYVHKRPHCDDFLKKVSKWFNLVVFTASVQEYADPVIDWLEQERKYFSARYYRQHCTFRNGAYIKDLSSVEPDLSKVMILDNSPLSYIFHEDNAIPIEGWINDPTDNDLLHILPMLESLQYVIDVRAILGLRRGEFEAAA